MKIYIAGPMTGIKDFNRWAFYAAEDELIKAYGAECFNPARHDEETCGVSLEGTNGDPGEIPNFNLRQALSDDTQYICHEADTIYMLKGWEKSAGANAEHKLAIALGLEIIYE